jgi:hypothetical protein
MRARSVGSPATSAAKHGIGETAKGTNSFERFNGIAVEPELVISAAERTEWYRRNPHVRPGVLEALAARGVLVIVPDGLVAGAVPMAGPMQGVRA